MKKLAIIISAFDCAEYIIDCIKSVKKQKRPPGWEYDIRIGVDGCQKTSEMLKKASILHYYSKSNVGAYVMRNSLIYRDYAYAYAYFDADDVMIENYLLLSIAALSNYQAVITGKYQTDENLNILGDPVIELGGAMSFTHNALEKVGGYHPCRCAGDTDLMYRLNNAGFEIKKIDIPLYYRRRHNKSLTRSGLTKFGGEYRKKVWDEMTAMRDKGLICVTPEIVEMEFVDAD